jgi:predicted Zn-dependent peptidase
MTIRKTVLSNGLTILTEAIPHIKSVCVGVWLKKGSRHERLEDNGISHFIEHLVFKGTRHKSAQQIALIIDSLGGQVDAFTGKEYTCFYFRALDEHVPTAMDLVTDIVTSPRFDVQDIEKERKVIFEEIRMVEDTPDELLYDIFSQSSWKGHPLARPIQGTIASVTAMTPERLLRHFRTSYVPSQMVIAAAGSLRHDSMVGLIRRSFGSLEGTATNGRISPPVFQPGVVKREKKNLEQLHVCLGVRSFPTNSGQRYPLFVLNTVLGGNMSSRLWQRVREKEGLAYSVFSAVNSFLDCGFLMVYAATNPKQGDRVVEVIVEEMRRLKKEPPTREEIRVARENLKGSLMLSLESSSARMMNLARQEIYFGRQASMDEMLRGLDRVRPVHLQELAEELLHGAPAALAALGRTSRFTANRRSLRF